MSACKRRSRKKRGGVLFIQFVCAERFKIVSEAAAQEDVDWNTFCDLRLSLLILNHVSG